MLSTAFAVSISNICRRMCSVFFPVYVGEIRDIVLSYTTVDSAFSVSRISVTLHLASDFGAITQYSDVSATLNTLRSIVPKPEASHYVSPMKSCVLIYLALLTNKQKTNSVAWVGERTIPTEQLPLVGEVSANFCGYRLPRAQRDVSLRPYSLFSRPGLC
jgi:hypothetical protein